MSQRPCACCGLLQKYPSVGLRLLRARSWVEAPNPPLSSPRGGAAARGRAAATRFDLIASRLGVSYRKAPLRGGGQLRANGEGLAEGEGASPSSAASAGVATGAGSCPPAAQRLGRRGNSGCGRAGPEGRREAATPGRNPTFCGPPPPPRGGRRPVTELPTPQTALGGGEGAQLNV